MAVAPGGGEWTAVRELLADRARLDELIGELTLEVGSDRRDVAAQRCVEAWAWSLAASPAAAIVAEGRYVDVDPAGLVVSLDLDPYFLPRFGIAEPAESDGGIPALVESLVAHLGPLVETLNALSGRPRAALWRGAADRVADGFLYAGDQLGKHDRGHALATEALSVSGQLAGPVVVDHVDVGAGTEPVHVRNGCCILHVVPGGVPCITCPLLDAGERRARTIEWLESEGRLG
jgi:hypothetical protein